MTSPSNSSCHPRCRLRPKSHSRAAVTLGKLRHPNALEVFDVGESEGTPYFVMEFVPGDNLDSWRQGRSPREVLECLRGAERGLAAAHAQGVSHRDFKPSNVIVGAGDRAKVADLGLAGVEVAQTVPSGGAAAIDSLTTTGAIMGTLAYMAPKLLDGGKASFVSDQFALCVTMYEVLYGRRPFSGGDARALSSAIRRGELPPAPQDVVIPRRARRALARGLLPGPHDRFPSVRALLHELRPGRVTSPNSGLGSASRRARGSSRPARLGSPIPSPRHVRGSPGSWMGPAAHGRARKSRPRSRSESFRPRRRLHAARSRVWMPTLSNGSPERHRVGPRRRTGSCPAMRLTCACTLSNMPRKASMPWSNCWRCRKRHRQVENGSELVATLPNLRLSSDLEALKLFSVLHADAAEAAQAEALDPVLSQAHAKTLVKDFDGAWEVL